MAENKYKLKVKRELTQIELDVGKALLDIENSGTELKKDLSEFFLADAKEYEVNGKKNAVLIHIPYGCLQILNKIHRKIVVELEKKLKKVVLITAKRTIQSKWIKKHKTQMKPRSRTLTQVFDAILDDFCLPSAIIAKRTRVRTDNSKFIKITLDEADRDVLKDKVDHIVHVYKALTTRQIEIEFKPDVSFYTYKKWTQQ